MTIFACACFSTDGQSVDAQLNALCAVGPKKLFRENTSGVKSDHTQIRRVLAVPGKSDALLVTCLNRLARSTRDLLNILDIIGQVRVGFSSLGEAWADNTRSHGRLMLTVLLGLAEFERELTRARTSEGSNVTKADSIHMDAHSPHPP